jgi:hypothetical protein
MDELISIVTTPAFEPAGSTVVGNGLGVNDGGGVTEVYVFTILISVLIGNVLILWIYERSA